MLNIAVFALQAENSSTGNARRPSDSGPNPPNSKLQKVLVLNTSIISFIFFFYLL